AWAARCTGVAIHLLVTGLHADFLLGERETGTKPPFSPTVKRRKSRDAAFQPRKRTSARRGVTNQAAARYPMASGIVEKEYEMRWIVALIVALILLPLAFRLLAFATHMAFGLIHLAVILAIVIFLVGLIRRMMLI